MILVELDYPFEIDGERIAELRMPAITAKHIRGAKLPTDNEDGVVVDAFLDIAARAAGHHPRILDKLDARDAFKVVGALGDFFGLTVSEGDQGKP